MINLPDHLRTGEKEAILALCTSLSQVLGDNLMDLYLFGSKARGDFHAESDIDVLVIVHRLDADSRWLVRATAADCSLEYDVLFNTHIYEKEQWEAIVARDDTLWREVQQDGVPLHDLVAESA